MLSVGMVHIFILKIKGCKNTKYHILYLNVNKTTKYSAYREIVALHRTDL